MIQLSVSADDLAPLETKMMTKTKRLFYLPFFLCISSVLSCSEKPVVPVSRELPSLADPIEESNVLESEMDSLLSDQISLLASRDYQSAKDNLKKAKDWLKSGPEDATYRREALHFIALGKSDLIRAQRNARKPREILVDVLADRREAVRDGAAIIYPYEFNGIDASLMDVATNIANNHTKNLKEDRELLERKYNDLSYRSILYTSLASSRETLRMAKEYGADVYAPRSLEVAEQRVKDTEAFILAHPNQREQIEIKSENGQKYASKVLRITLGSRNSRRISSEELSLREKSEFNRIFDDARSLFTENEAEVLKQGDRLLIRLKGLQFPIAGSALNDTNYPLLEKVEKVIKDLGRSSLVVEGNADANGGSDINEKLSSERAEVVKNYLIANAPLKIVDATAVGHYYQTNGNRDVDVLIQPENTD